MKDEYRVRTEVKENGKIEQTVEHMGHDTVRNVILHRIVDTEEKQIKEALIALGWTPPNKDNKYVYLRLDMKDGRKRVIDQDGREVMGVTSVISNSACGERDTLTIEVVQHDGMGEVIVSGGN